jgi:outer membrane biosynthesis protein TonB
MHMKWPLLVLLLAPVTLTSCRTTHDAAVATFRVLDAPHQYIRRKLEIDENGETTTTTSTTTVQQTAPPNDNVYAQPYQQAPPSPPSEQTTRATVNTEPPPPPPQRHVVATEERHETAPRRTPTPAPRVTSRATTKSSTEQPNEPKTTSTSQTAATEKSSLPYAKPVPGKPGYVFSPFDPNGGYVDVTGFAPGSKVKDPYSGKIFRVP